jgi:dimethylargininase
MPLTARRPSLSSSRRVVAALAAGASVALATFGVTTLIYFVSNGAAAENVAPIIDVFLPGTLLLFVLASLAFTLGAARRRRILAPVGLVAAALAAILGSLFRVGSAGTPLAPEVIAVVVGTLIGINTVFVIVAVVVFVTVGIRVWRRLTGGGVAPRIAVVRVPSTRLAEGELTHLDRVAVDTDLVDAQWDAYVAALETHGFEIVEVEPADHLPDSVFIEDALLVFGDLAVITSPGAESRRAEIHGARETARALGLRIVELELPGTLDGGDVLVVGETVYVGRSGRTNAEGIRQLRALLAPLGLTVVAVPVTKVLHLKSAVTALPDGTVVGQAKLVEHPDLFERFLALPEAGASVVVLDAETVLMAASVPKSAALIESLGYRVVTVDISEFEKLEGCVTCLSVRL